MSAERLDKILHLMFKRIRVDEQAKANLKNQFFSNAALSDDELSLIAAAGHPAERNLKTKKDDKRDGFE